MKKLIITPILAMAALATAQDRALIQWDAKTGLTSYSYGRTLKVFEKTFLGNIELVAIGSWNAGEGREYLSGGFGLGRSFNLATGVDFFVAPKVEFAKGRATNYGFVFGLDYKF